MEGQPPSYPPAGQESAPYPPAAQPGYPPQEGYPPPQQGYPPPQEGYPPPQQGYPPPQQGYLPPQQQGYPPQQGYAPPPQGAYPQQQPTPHDYKDAPPPYAGVAPPQIQTTTSTNVVVVQQPGPTLVTTQYLVTDNYLTLSVILTVICCLCGTWYALICTVPAIVFAVNAREAEARGDVATKETNARLALGCDIGGCVTWVVVLTFLIIVNAASRG